jgi:predicted nucleic acid-binding protein
MGKGLGYVDVHLIASAILTGVSIWTRDKRLAQTADNLHLKY